MALEVYRQKRNFERTREPRGKKVRRKGYEFVIQKHAARRLHYDFRLELDGVFLSWAVPKGPSLDPGVKRLAMQVEDHPLEYGDFEGVIPKGEYGGGTVLLWDRGTWRPEGDAREMLEKGRLTFELEGEKLHGTFHLVRAAGGRNGDARRWLLMKRNDAAAQPGSDAAILETRKESVASGRDLPEIASDPDHVWTSKRTSGKARRASGTSGHAQQLERLRGEGLARAKLPAFVEPELATLVKEAPEGDDWVHEIKLDGYRILARVERGRATLASRRGNDWSDRMPSIASALGSLPVESALLDGEVVALDERGVSSFQKLQNSMEAGRDVHLVYFAFDALFLNGFDLRGLPLTERKALLKSTLHDLDNPRVRLGDHLEGGGPAFFERACQMGLEGIVCKRAGSHYVSGRGKDWLKVKCLARQEFVIGGYTEPGGSRSHFGALLLGVRENGGLSYAGKVGTGFTQASLSELSRKLQELEQPKPPFANPPRGAEARGVHWVRPELVAEVAYVERTHDGLIRHSSFQGLREDKAPAEVRRERAISAPAAKQEANQTPARKKATAKKKPTKDTTPKKKPTSDTTPKKEPASAKTSPEKSAPARAARRHASELPAAPSLDLSRFEITNPDRVLFPEQGLKKRDLMLHYARVARWMLPHVALRPLMLLRCPEGTGKQCFHQKHPSRGMPKAVQEVLVPQKRGQEAQLMIRDVDGLLGLVQMGGLEIHTWGSLAGAVEYPDQLVFDLDPDVGLPWERVVEAALAVEEQLERHGLTGFVKTTGGKGLHVVVPVEPSAHFDEAKKFCRQIAETLVKAAPSRYVATMTKARRSGKIFIDYFRNGLGATAIAPFSTRARAGAPVAVPVTWDELEQEVRGDHFNVRSVGERLAQLERDPWEGFEEARAALPAS